MPLIFSYGSLQQESVQLSTFGRLLRGERDYLPGFELSLVRIDDPQIAAKLGKAHYSNATFNGRNASRVSGTALEVTDAELAVADVYEQGDGYMRIAVVLASGKQAWVYVDARTAPGAGRRGLARTLAASAAAVVAGFGLLIVGGGVSGALMVLNLRLAPSLPLFLPATLLWLWLIWRYVRGDGWPRSTSERRRSLLRVRTLSLREWCWALVAGGLAITAVMGIAFMTYRFASLPEAAYRSPFDVSSLPPWTLVSVFASVALTAAVVEEAAFRGYMLYGIQREFGWVAGIGVVSILFYMAHLSHAYATLAFAPFFAAHGLALGLLVFYTRSIVPGVVLHAVSDLIVLPMQYGVIRSAGEWDFVGQGWLALVAGAAAIPAFRQVARARQP